MSHDWYQGFNHVSFDPIITAAEKELERQTMKAYWDPTPEQVAAGQYMIPKKHDEVECASCGVRRSKHGQGQNKCPRFVKPVTKDPVRGGSTYVASVQDRLRDAMGISSVAAGGGKSATQEMLESRHVEMLVQQIEYRVRADTDRRLHMLAAKVEALEKTLAQYHLNVRVEKAIHEPIDWTKVRDEEDNLTELDTHHGFPTKDRVVF